MGVLIFDLADVLPLVAHAAAAPDHRRETLSYSPGGDPVAAPARPALILVHDDGVYLMSSGLPRDIVSGTRSRVAYAQGCDPDKNAGHWECARDLVGGDDFAEFLPPDIFGQLSALGPLVARRLIGGTFRIEMLPTAWKFSVDVKKRLPR